MGDAAMTSFAAMWRVGPFASALCLVGGLAWQVAPAEEQVPYPDQVTVKEGTFASAYFDFSYPLPPGWTEGLAGPEPSLTAYYVLKMFVPAGKFDAMVLVAAQDLFFMAKPFADATEMAQDIARSRSALTGMTVDHAPTALTLAGRSFARVDVSGFG